jgi:hypothetical protein
VVLGIGFIARLSIKTDLDFFLSGRSLPAARAANRFDIRRLISGVFTVYGLILVALGAFGSHASKHKADGINVNLWTGLGMLVFAGLMIFWALSRPTVPEPPETRGRGSGRIRRSPAT